MDDLLASSAAEQLHGWSLDLAGDNDIGVSLALATNAPNDPLRPARIVPSFCARPSAQLAPVLSRGAAQCGYGAVASATSWYRCLRGDGKHTKLVGPARPHPGASVGGDTRGGG